MLSGHLDQPKYSCHVASQTYTVQYRSQTLIAVTRSHCTVLPSKTNLPPSLRIKWMHGLAMSKTCTVHTWTITSDFAAIPFKLARADKHTVIINILINLLT